MPPGPTALQSMQLSLFDDVPPAPAPPVAARPPAPPPPAPTAFSHPNPQREIVLGSHRVAYALRRSRRRSIGFVVGAEGLAVSAPRWVGVAEIEAALREKSAWILRKLHEQRERARRLDAARIDWRDGVAIPFLGEPVTVVLDGRTTGAVLQADAPSGQRRLNLGLPPTAAPEQIRDVVQSWLQRQARRIFEERCAIFVGSPGTELEFAL